MQNVGALFQQGFVMHQQGYLAEAKNFYEQVLAIRPEHFDALHLLGLICAQNKKPAQALDFLKKATSINTNYAPAFYNLGVVLQDLNRFNEALVSLDRAIALKPDYAEAYSSRGNALHELKQYQQSIASHDKAILINPNHAKTWYNRGNSLLELQKYDQSVASYDRAIALKPDYAEAYSNMGLALYELKQYQQSVAYYDRAIALKPDYVEAYSSRGNALHELKQYQQSVASYDRAIALKPDYAQVYSNRGGVLSSICRYEEAAESYREAIRVDPNNLYALSGWLMSVNYHASLNLQDALTEAKIYGSKVSKNSIPKFTKWSLALKTNKLKIGFVSGDLCSHPVGYFIEGLIEHLDQNQFELYAFTTHYLTDELTSRIKPFFNEWIPIYGMSDLDAAVVIHEKNIHVLIDLSGHTKHNRLPIFSYKPSPVQVTYLGLPNTTGVPEIDFVIGDSYSLPSEYERQFTERIWRLPHVYLCLKPPRTKVKMEKLPALENGFVTFGCFNNLSKMNNTVIETWSRILKSTPNSRLYLKTNQLSDLTIQEQILQKFKLNGIEENRLILKGFLDSHTNHLDEYTKVDIALDTFPYPGVTTSFEAIWMGVPVLNLKGNSFLSSTATSISINAGLNDWISISVEDYINKAFYFASDLQRLAQIKILLRERSMRSPLFDNARFAKNFGNALKGMYFQSPTIKKSHN
jgi:protein O-GlcNAc transferase